VRDVLALQAEGVHRLGGDDGGLGEVDLPGRGQGQAALEGAAGDVGDFTPARASSASALAASVAV
jgi:hypothetical protein